MNDHYIKVTLDDGSVAEFDVTKGEPNPCFEKLTSQVRISNDYLSQCEEIAAAEHCPPQLVLDRAMAVGLKKLRESVAA